MEHVDLKLERAAIAGCATAAETSGADLGRLMGYIRLGRVFVVVLFVIEWRQSFDPLVRLGHELVG